MATFLAIESRSPHPMLDLTLFRKPAFNGVSAVAFALSASMFALFLYLTLYIQGVLGYSPLQAGLRFLPMTLVSFVVAPIAARLSNRIPIRVLLGVGLATVGVGLLLIHGVAVGSSWTALLPGFLIAGAGIGITNPGIGQAAIGVVPAAKSGMGSGINTTFRQVGIATGVAGARRDLPVPDRQQADGAASPRPGRPQRDRRLGRLGGGAGGIPQGPGQAHVVHAAKVAFISGFNEIVLIGAGIAITGAVLGFLLVRSRDFVAQGAPPPEQAPAPSDATAAEMA